MKLKPLKPRVCKVTRRAPARPLLKKDFYALGGYSNPDLFTRQGQNGARRYFMA